MHLEDHEVIKKIVILLRLDRECLMVIMFLVGFIWWESSEIHITRTGFHIMVRNQVALNGAACNIRTVSRPNG